MDDAGGMGGVGGGKDLQNRPDGFLNGHGPQFEPVGQGHGFDCFDGDGEVAADLDDAVASKDIWVLERGKDAAFAEETGGAFRIVAQTFGENLQLLNSQALDVARAESDAFAGTIQIVQQFIPVYDLSDGERHR